MWRDSLGHALQVALSKARTQMGQFTYRVSWRHASPCLPLYWDHTHMEKLFHDGIKELLKKQPDIPIHIIVSSASLDYKEKDHSKKTIPGVHISISQNNAPPPISDPKVYDMEEIALAASAASLPKVAQNAKQVIEAHHGVFQWEGNQQDYIVPLDVRSCK